MHISGARTEVRECLARFKAIDEGSEEPSELGQKWFCEVPLRRLGGALVLRLGLQRLKQWQSATRKVQETFRMHRALQNWRVKAAYYRGLCTTMQCAWRSYVARQVALDLRYKFYSPWEQQLSDETGEFFYFNVTTNTSSWQEPEEPYKPFG